jgi:two-component system sensor histidine kinase PilS (NtrC family)
MLGLQGKDLARARKWIAIFRLVVYTFLPIISLGFLWKFQPPTKLVPLIGLIGLALLLNLGQLLGWLGFDRLKKLRDFSEDVISQTPRNKLLGWSILSWIPDMIMISGIVYYTGGPVSDFWFLYILVIILGGLNNATKGAFSAAAFSALVYISMMYLSFQGVIGEILPGETLGRGGLGPSGIRADLLPTLSLKAFLVLSFFVLTAAIVSYITQRYHSKAGELEVKTSELHQLRLDTDTILETIPAGILACDSQGNILYSNQSGMNILELPSYAITQECNIQDLLESQPIFLQVIREMLDSSISPRVRSERWCTRTGMTHPHLEVTLPLANSTCRPVGIDASYLQDRKGGYRGLVVYFTDLTEAKALERDLRISDRLTAVGELARDLAHEIRNPLAVIRGSVEFMARDLHPGGEKVVHPHMERLMAGILRESDRLNSLVYEFLDFSRLPPPECAILPVKVVLKSLQKLPIAPHFDAGDPSAQSGVEVVNGLTSKTDCFADRDQLLRALSSLIQEINRQQPDQSRLPGEAPSAPQILIAEPGRACAIWSEARLHNDMVIIPNNQVGFVIRFPGQALSESEVEDLFRPFRHADSKHRGLGLCTAHRIIMGHRGDVRVFNHAEDGLALLVLIPLPPTGDDPVTMSTQRTNVLPQRGTPLKETVTRHASTEGEVA